MKGFTSIVFFSVNFVCVVKYILSDNQTGVCTTNQLGELLGCCANYRKVGTKCEECWPGTYGINCKYNCPFGYYGRFCRQKCQCSTCNHVSGCAILHSAVTESDIEEDVIFDWRTVVISVSGCCGVSIIVALVFYCKLRKGPSNLLIPVHSVHSNAEAIIRPQLNHCKPNKENKCFTENDYNCEMEPYDTLNLKVQRDTCIDEELCPSYDSSVFNQCEKIEYETKPMGRHEKPTKEHTNKQTNKTQKGRYEEKSLNFPSGRRNAWASGTRDLKPANNDKRQKRKQIDETIKILNDFKPKTQDNRNIDIETKDTSLHPKTQNKSLLMYSFASSTEIV